MGEALKTNSSLAYLNLEGNEIGAEGAKLIGEALKTNSSLTNLELWNNQIGDEGAKLIGEALKTNSSLTYLNLDRNGIGYNLQIEIATDVYENSNSPDKALARVVGNYLLYTVVLKKEMSEEFYEKFASNYNKVNKELLDQFLKENNSSYQDIANQRQEQSDRNVMIKYTHGSEQLQEYCEMLATLSDLIGDTGMHEHELSQ